MAALLPSLSADVVSRRHSVRGEEPGNVIAADGTRGPAVHLLPQDGRQTSSSHVSCDVETPSVESQTRVSVVLHNDDDSDDDDDDDDDDAAADMETALSIHQTGMMEHDTAMTSSVLIQHTVVDTSSSDGEYECRQQLATDELLTTATDLRSTLQHIQTSVSQPARSSSSVALALALHTRHCATQTVQDQWTQTVVEQFTQTDKQFHGDTVDEFSGTTTQHRVNSSASAEVRHDRPQNTLDGNSSMWSTMTLDTAQLKTMTRSTQTLIRLRLGADEQLAYNPGGLSLLHTTSSRDAATDLTLTDLMVGDVVQSRDFATQTFGQFTTDEAAGLPSHTPTAHQQHIYRDENDKGKDRSRGEQDVEGHQHHRHERRRHKPTRHADRVHTPTSTEDHSNSRYTRGTSTIIEGRHYHCCRKHKRESRDKERKNADRSKHHVRQRAGPVLNCNLSSVCSPPQDVSRIDLLKIMLHQIKDITKVSAVATDVDE